MLGHQFKPGSVCLWPATVGIGIKLVRDISSLLGAREARDAGIAVAAATVASVGFDTCMADGDMVGDDTFAIGAIVMARGFLELGCSAFVVSDLLGIFLRWLPAITRGDLQPTMGFPEALVEDSDAEVVESTFPVLSFSFCNCFRAIRSRRFSWFLRWPRVTCSLSIVVASTLR